MAKQRRNNNANRRKGAIYILDDYNEKQGKGDAAAGDLIAFMPITTRDSNDRIYDPRHYRCTDNDGRGTRFTYSTNIRQDMAQEHSSVPVQVSLQT
jgi:hypothetical protein